MKPHRQIPLKRALRGCLTAAALLVMALPGRAQALTPEEAKTIAMEAYISATR